MPLISVLIPTHEPQPSRLQRTLSALRAQTLASTSWETILVDNASPAPLSETILSACAPANLTVVREPKLGLTSARLRGIRSARGDLLVFVDDDNILNPQFLEVVQRIFTAHPRLGAAGGPIAGDFECSPPNWVPEFFGLLALRDLGRKEIIAPGGDASAWPDCAPVGAGMCVRRNVAEIYAEQLSHDPARLTLDRAGQSLASGGDNDLVFTVLQAGWEVGYFPGLALTHLIPAGRLEPDYLARLNRGVMRTWVRVLALHGQFPWPKISRSTVRLRQLRAWWRFRAWQSAAHRIRWQGACGQLEGQADLADL